MKKKILVLVGILIYSIKGFALGGVNIMTSPTASSLGNPVQQAEISSDSVFYNQAAIGFLDDGQYFGAGILFIGTDYKQKINGPRGNSLEVTTDTMQYIPSISYVYKNGDRAYYLGVGSLGQGGSFSLSIDPKLSIMSDATLDYLAPGIVLGMTQKLKDNLAISLGVRYIYVYQKLEFSGINQERELKMTSDGITPEISVYYKATSKLDLGVKYLFKTKMSQNISGDAPGMGLLLIAERNDYPAILSTGGSYEINDKNKVYLGHNFIFEDANYIYGGGYNGIPNYSNTQEYMIGYKRKINDKFDINIGYTYVDRGKKDGVLTIKELNVNVYGASLVYHQNENTQYTLSVATNRYDSRTANFITAERTENIVGIAINKKI